MNKYQTKVNYHLITNFTDNDLYKFTMCCAIVNSFPEAVVRYRFQDRNNTVYPVGFAEELKQQIKYLADIHITTREINFMRNKCYYLPEWFLTYLRSVSLNPDNFNVEQDAEGHLSFEFEGTWAVYVLYEVQLLAIIARLYYILTGKDLESTDYSNEYYNMTYDKAKKMLNAGCTFAEFGTRRRYSFETQDIAVRACKNAYNDYLKKAGKVLQAGRFSGTSNVYLAMKYDLTPIGTMAHEFISGIAGIYGSPLEANHIAMKEWEKTYNGALGTFLYDTFGFELFATNFSDKYARSFDGLRVDSGDNLEQYLKIMDLYRKHRVNGLNKTVMFSNALDTDSYIELANTIYSMFPGAKFAAGIGTHLTNDMKIWNIDPMNIVIKLVFISVTGRRPLMPTAKFSNTPGKYIAGDETIADMWKYQIKNATK